MAGAEGCHMRGFNWRLLLLSLEPGCQASGHEGQSQWQLVRDSESLGNTMFKVKRLNDVGSKLQQRGLTGSQSS